MADSSIGVLLRVSTLGDDSLLLGFAKNAGLR